MADSSKLAKLKILLGIAGPDRDALLNTIIGEVEARLSARFLGGGAVPDELEHIVVAVSVVRFNRIGSEGMTLQTVEGRTDEYINDDFGPYISEIARWAAAQTDTTPGEGVVRFL